MIGPVSSESCLAIAGAAVPPVSAKKRQEAPSVLHNAATMSRLKLICISNRIDEMG
jgi:hypothetical protein